jgi:hypothetical protein
MVGLRGPLGRPLPSQVSFLVSQRGGTSTPGRSGRRGQPRRQSEARGGGSDSWQRAAESQVMSSAGSGLRFTSSRSRSRSRSGREPAKRKRWSSRLPIRILVRRRASWDGSKGGRAPRGLEVGAILSSLSQLAWRLSWGGRRTSLGSRLGVTALERTERQTNSRLAWRPGGSALVMLWLAVVSPPSVAPWPSSSRLSGRLAVWRCRRGLGKLLELSCLVAVWPFQEFQELQVAVGICGAGLAESQLTQKPHMAPRLRDSSGPWWSWCCLGGVSMSTGK